jgi:arginine repressor
LRQSELQEKIDQYDAWNIDTKLERAMDALNVLKVKKELVFYQVEKEEE